VPDNIIDGVFKRFQLPGGKLALLERLATTLLDKGVNDPPAKDNLLKALKRLAVDGKFKLPDGNVADNQLSGLATLAQNAIKVALAGSGVPQLALISELSAGAIKFINNSFDQCGGNDVSNPPPGPPVELKNGRHVIVFWVEEDENGLPMLPAVGGDPRFARSRLVRAFESWEVRLKMDVTRTDDRTAANLIVSGRTFGSEVDDSVLALTDIGPPNGTQVRMIFDLAEIHLSKDDFEACAAHEFGHAIGIKHADVSQSQPLQLMNGTISAIREPQDDDLAAAVRKGWVRSA